MNWKRIRGALAGMLIVCTAGAPSVWADQDPIDAEGLRGLESTLRAQMNRNLNKAIPAAVPDIFGPGSVLTVGNVYMKVTNFAVLGNPFNNISSDPSGQWPGASGIEYLNFIIMAVGGVNSTATDPTAVRRVSYVNEWFPPSASDPADKMYRAYDGVINGARFVNDDGDHDPLTGDPLIDEDFLDGHDNDGDGRIDEDYAALGQLMFSCVMRDDTPAALANVANEKHVPLVLECRQLGWAYSIPGFQDFDVVEYNIYNRSGHTLDSMFFGFRVNIDAGPASSSSFFNEDQDVPTFPQGEFTIPVDPNDPRYQLAALPNGSHAPLCPQRKVRVNGYSVVDNDGDEGRTTGVASFLLFGHTIDPLGITAPRRVGFRAFRSFVAGTPYQSNGNPSIDQQRFEFMSSNQNIDPATGFISVDPGDQPADYTSWCAVGPFLKVPDGGSIQCTIGFAIHGDAELAPWKDLQHWPDELARYQGGFMKQEELLARHPALANALGAQLAYEGVYEAPRVGFEDKVPNCHGCETGVKLARGSTPTFMPESCPDRDAITKLVTDNAYTWFDFDCDVCTGVYDENKKQGYFLRHWNAESPPPSPNLNVASGYNYSDNPSRVVAGGDNQVTLAWDNLSETTADPKTAMFDFRSYRVWKVAGWRRPVGSSGPNDDDWALLGEFRLWDYDADNDDGDGDKFSQSSPDSNFRIVNGVPDCPQVFVPNYLYPAGSTHCPEGCRDTATVGICLRTGDLWDRQSGQVIRPDLSVPCQTDPHDPSPHPPCLADSGRVVGGTAFFKRTRYGVGRYRYVDREVKNGFTYFYSVTAGDSTGGGELFGRRSAVEADGVVPQAAAATSGKGVWVVPNPYRGYKNISDRSSSWDLTPNATDPTGTHIDFLGMPRGAWKIRIYTISGDLVQELHSDDPVNDSIRGAVTDPKGTTRPGYNRQQDSPDDGQARWNLISRNGQDVVSGIYLFVVDSQQGQQRGKFVVVR